MSNCGGNCAPSCSPEGLNFEDLKRCEPNKTPFTRRKILIICTGNSCRSQMAQGWLRFFDERLDVYSAGTRPEKKVNPNAVKVMEEVGINIKGHYTKHIDKFTKDNFDYAITVCDSAKESCPVFTGNVKNHLHIGFEDPADAIGTEEEILNVYRKIRDEIKVEFYKFYKELFY